MFPPAFFAPTYFPTYYFPPGFAPLTMTTSLKTGRNTWYRPTHAQSSKGEWFTYNGLDRPQRWNGKTASTQDVGLLPPTTATTIGSSGSGSLSGTYTAYVRAIDSEGIPSALSPISNEITISGKASITYTSVPLGPDSRTTARQIFRNTDGQEDTYYLDATISDNTTNSTSSTKTDTQLEAAEELPILTDEGFPSAERFGVPPYNKRVCVNAHNRFFMGVDARYDEGCVVVTSGSTTVYGIGTHFTSAMVDREFMVPGDTAGYNVNAVDTTLQTLTLDTAYAGTTSAYALYAIQADATERNLWYFTSLGEPESSHADDSFRLLFDGDLDTAAFTLAYSLYIARTNSIHRITFASNPTEDLNSTKVAFRGVMNPHCWAAAENVVFCLDPKGIHVFDGNGSKAISGDIQDIFQRSRLPSTYRVNWASSKWWFATHDPVEEVVRFHVNLSDGGFPKEAICYSYRHDHFWIEGYPFRVGHAIDFLVNSQPNQVFGGEFGSNYMRTGTRDMHHGTDDWIGTVSSANLMSLTVNGANLHGVSVNAPISIYDGKGKGQTRRIVQVANGVITIKTPWTIIPDSTSKFVIGSVGWKWRSRIFRTFQRDGVDEDRRIKLITEPTTNPHLVNLRIFRDQRQEADSQALDFARSGAYSTFDERDIEWWITKNPTDDDPDTGEFTGFRDWNFDEGLEEEAMGDRYVALELGGFGVETVTVHTLDLIGLSV